jgi:hypothetical protein
VIESTNIHGVAFPLKASVKHLGISPEDRNRLTVAMACQIEISRISFAAADFARQVHPERLYVEDYRPHHLRGTHSRGLMVTNDQWTTAPQ